MGHGGIPFRPVPGTMMGLRQEGRRDQEALARREAMMRAEALGRAASECPQCWEVSEDSRRRFGDQLARLDERTGSIAVMDAVLSEDARRSMESRRVRDALRDAERTETASTLGALPGAEELG